jgi:acetyl esterase/lipase
MKDDEPPAREVSLPQQILLNVSYGKHPLQTLDIYLPEDRSVRTTKSLILVHGGGWNSGSKADFQVYIDAFRNRLPDWAIFNVSYRLATENNVFPAQEKDIKSAVECIEKRAANYGVNPESFALLGVSAGAHLALLQAYKQKKPAIKAVIDYFGPSDLTAMYNQPWHPLVPLALQMVTGTTPEKNRGLYYTSSPANFIAPDTPPTLILHGAKDQVVDASQSKSLAAKLTAAGVKHELHIYPSAGHGRWYGEVLVSSFDHIEKFLTEHVG